jgi:prepilin-type processing-associated H-X9-DG protein
MSDVTRPSEVPVMADAMWRGGGPKTTGLPGERPEFNGQWSGTQYDFKHFAMHRHNKGIQLVFVDGSARYVQVRDLWTLSWHRNFEVDYAKSRGKNFFPEWMR